MQDRAISISSGSNANFPGFVISSSTIAIDFWPKNLYQHLTHYFLTHAHTDHTQNLDATWSKPLYCTETTKRLIAELNGVDSALVFPLELGRTHVMELSKQETFNVTLIDANHCAGACMFLFEGYFGTVLCTGDFRYSPHMFVDTPLRDFVTDTDAAAAVAGNANTEFSGVSSRRHVDICYLDNTYLHEKFARLPTRGAARDQIVRVIEKSRELEPTALFQLHMKTLGKEDLLIDLATYFQSPVSVSARRYQRYVHTMRLDAQHFTTELDDKTLLFVRDLRGTKDVADKSSCSIAATIASWMPPRRIVHIVPTGLGPVSSMSIGAGDNAAAEEDNNTANATATATTTATDDVEAASVSVDNNSAYAATYHQIDYTDHSSYAELLEFVRRLQPARVIPLVRRMLPGHVDITDLSPLERYLSGRPAVDSHDKFRLLVVTRRDLPDAKNRSNRVTRSTRNVQTSKSTRHIPARCCKKLGAAQKTQIEYDSPVKQPPPPQLLSPQTRNKRFSSSTSSTSTSSSTSTAMSSLSSSSSTSLSVQIVDIDNEDEDKSSNIISRQPTVAPNDAAADDAKTKTKNEDERNHWIQINEQVEVFCNLVIDEEARSDTSDHANQSEHECDSSAHVAQRSPPNLLPPKDCLSAALAACSPLKLKPAVVRIETLSAIDLERLRAPTVRWCDQATNRTHPITPRKQTARRRKQRQHVSASDERHCNDDDDDDDDSSGKSDADGVAVVNIAAAACAASTQNGDDNEIANGSSSYNNDFVLDDDLDCSSRPSSRGSILIENTFGDLMDDSDARSVRISCLADMHNATTSSSSKSNSNNNNKCRLNNSVRMSRISLRDTRRWPDTDTDTDAESGLAENALLLDGTNTREQTAVASEKATATARAHQEASVAQQSSGETMAAALSVDQQEEFVDFMSERLQCGIELLGAAPLVNRDEVVELIFGSFAF